MFKPENGTNKEKITERYTRNASELVAFAKEEWVSISNDAIHKLYECIPKQLKDIIKNHSRRCK